MRYLRQNTPTALSIGPFLSSTDGVTALTGLTVTSIDVDIYKHSDTHPLTKTDLTITASGGPNDMAHVANGWYSLELAAGDVDTLGRWSISAVIAGALPVWHELTVLSGPVYDEFVNGLGTIEFTYTLTNTLTSAPIVGATVRFATDLAGLNTVWTGTTDAAGIARNACSDKPRLPAGTYYVFRTLTGYTFANPDTEVIG